MFVFLSRIIMFYVLQTIMLFLKESNIKIKRLFFYLFVIFETGLPLYWFYVKTVKQENLDSLY